MASITRACRCCGQEFTPSTKKGIYCSPRCAGVMANRAYDARRRAARKPNIKTCGCCGEEFIAKTAWQKFCGPECYQESVRQADREKHQRKVGRELQVAKMSRIAPRTFDFMMIRSGARVTTDFRAEAA